MRTKRKQRRQQKVAIPPEVKGLPDPFSALNGDLVEQEVLQSDMCPCCIDRMDQRELDKEEVAYLAWVAEGR